MEVLMAILEQIGLPLVMKWITGSVDEDKAKAMLEAEYRAAELAAKQAEDAKFGMAPVSRP